MEGSPAGLSSAPIKTESQRTFTIATVVIFAALSILAAFTSSGFLEADACTHYLYARFAILEPHFLVNVWGRPVCTALYAIPAHFGGLRGVRMMSLATAIAIALVAMQIAKKQGYRWPALALGFTLAQPLVFLHSFSELTELPFALLLALGFWAYQHRRFAVMALIIGITPLGRPEGFGFVALAALALVLHGRLIALLILPLPLIGWSYAGWTLYGKVGHWYFWLRDNWPYQSESLYQSGSLFHFVISLPAVVSPMMFPATIAGIAIGIHLLIKRWDVLLPLPLREEKEPGSHSLRCEILITLIPLMILVGHSLLYWRGKMASNGELRYMLVVAPFWGLLSARGWQWFFETFNFRHTFRWAGAAMCLPILANISYKVVPLTLSRDWLEAGQIVKWYETSGIAKTYPHLCVAHPGISYFLDQSPTDKKLAREWSRTTVLHPPTGTLLVWDPIYGVFNADANRSVKEPDLAAGGWKQVDVPGLEKTNWKVMVSPVSESAK